MSSEFIEEPCGKVCAISKESKFRWVINAKSICSVKKNEYLSSPVICTSKGTQILQWQIMFYPKGSDESSSKHTAIFLKNCNDFDVEIKFSFAFLDKYSKDANVRKVDEKFKLESKSIWGFEDFAEKDYLWTRKKVTINQNNLTILFTIFHHDQIDFNKNQTNSSKMNTCAELFTRRKFTDITVKSNGQNFDLHKCILATHSIVFEKMFETDMKEKDESIIKINDIKPEVLHHFFEFMYTGQVNGIEQVAYELYCVANKYFVSQLTEICETIMCSNVNVNNAIKYLKLAESTNAKNLREKIIKLIASNLENFTTNPEFKTLGESYPKLLLEIMEILGHKKIIFK